MYNLSISKREEPDIITGEILANIDVETAENEPSKVSRTEGLRMGVPGGIQLVEPAVHCATCNSVGAILRGKWGKLKKAKTQ